MLKQVIQKRSIVTAPSYLPVKGKYNSRSSPSNFKPKSIQPGLYYQPSPSIPSPLQKTPNAFLPNNDPRKVNKSDYTQQNISYMPPLSQPREKKHHLTTQQVDEIISLRLSDPYKYTRKVLAEKYQCSEFFISLVSESTPAKKLEMAERLAYIKSSWSNNKAQARQDREKRKKNWLSDA